MNFEDPAHALYRSALRGDSAAFAVAASNRLNHPLPFEAGSMVTTSPDRPG